MTYNPAKHHRRSIRLPGYDYTTPGAYFVTACINGGNCVLGEVVDEVMVLSPWGKLSRQLGMYCPSTIQM